MKPDDLLAVLVFGVLGLGALLLLVMYRALGIVDRMRTRLANMERALARAEAAPIPFVPPRQQLPVPQPPPPARIVPPPAPPVSTDVDQAFMPGSAKIRSHRRNSPDQTQQLPRQVDAGSAT